MTVNTTKPDERSSLTGLDAHKDARSIIRLIQCPQCSYPLRGPLTLPCGNSLCRRCLPPLYKREHITYPMTQGRNEGFVCPFKDCGLEHSMGYCSTDVALNKLVDVFINEILRYREMTSDTPTLLDERLHWKNIIDSSVDIMPRSRVLHGGRLVATYTFAEMGELNYFSDVAYTTISPSGDTYQYLDVAVLEHLREATRLELDCQVCYALLLDPLTTSCGHTFCRKCVARVLDHSNLCPICRRRLPLHPGASAEPSNKALSHILQGLNPELVALRQQAAAEEESGFEDNMNVPLFVCTLAYPAMPTFLHIFEPRYRLMIRRAVESGDRKFGMMMYNRTMRSQGNLGPTQFMQYGTLLHVSRMELLPDGRSLIETIGVSRFRVLQSAVLDGYIVGRIERIDDISVAEEENLEARETSAQPAANADSVAQLNRMSTQDLLQVGLNFIAKGRAASAPWLHERVLAAYGQPPADPATFPYWLASVLPIAEDEKYKLLPTTSVRERLKISARWVRRLEAAKW